MALETKAYGLRARKSEFPGTPPTMVTDIAVPNAYGTALYAGDPISLSTSGVAKRYASGEVAQGIARGFRWINPSDGRPMYTKYLPASTTQSGTLEGFATPVVEVEIAPGGTFDMLANAALSAGHVGKYFAFAFGSADTVMNQSGVTMDVSSVGTTIAEKDVQLIGLVREESNALTDSNPKVAVRLLRTSINLTA